MRHGVRVAVSQAPGRLLTWAQPQIVQTPPEVIDPSVTDSAWLHLAEDDARAMYEALAAYFGGTGHDTVALRRDYDAERKRVDRLIEYATEAQVQLR